MGGRRTAYKRFAIYLRRGVAGYRRPLQEKMWMRSVGGLSLGYYLLETTGISRTSPTWGGIASIKLSLGPQ